MQWRLLTELILHGASAERKTSGLDCGPGLRLDTDDAIEWSLRTGAGSGPGPRPFRRLPQRPQPTPGGCKQNGRGDRTLPCRTTSAQSSPEFTTSIDEGINPADFSINPLQTARQLASARNAVRRRRLEARIA